MLDPRQLRTHPDFFATQLARRGFVFDFEQFNQLENTRKILQKNTEDLQAERNRLSKSAGQAKARGEDIEPIRAQVVALAAQLTANEQALSQLQESFENWLLQLPNIPHPSVPDGHNENDNVEIRRWGTPRTLDNPKDHLDIAGEKMAFDLAAKLTGSRFVVLEGNVARLHRALTQFMLDLHTEAHGYTEVYTPYIVHADSLRGTGQLPKFAEDLFKLEGEQPWYLIPTAEVPVTNLLRDTITPAENLPRRYVCHTPCFRAEAGSAGRDTRGMIRQHQFEKVELVHFVLPEAAEQALESLTQHAETVLQKLELPYRVMALCAGDMGFSAHKTYDLEVWLPAQGRYREISSCSHFETFQARRLKARYRSADGKPALLHTLNGSGLAVGRTLVALLENGQQADGSVYIPLALRHYLSGTEFLRL